MKPVYRILVTALVRIVLHYISERLPLDKLLEILTESGASSNNNVVRRGNAYRRIQEVAGGVSDNQASLAIELGVFLMKFYEDKK